MWTKAYWLATAERAVKTFAQTFLALLGVTSVDTVTVAILHADWSTDLKVAGVAAGLSVLTSIISSAVRNDGPSLATETTAPVVAGYEPNHAALNYVNPYDEADPDVDPPEDPTLADR